MGKLLVFESGAVKLQMGDVLLDVAAGTPCQFRQEVASINAREGHFVFLGDVAQRVVCSPNVEQLIRSASFCIDNCFVCNHTHLVLQSSLVCLRCVLPPLCVATAQSLTRYLIPLGGQVHYLRHRPKLETQPPECHPASSAHLVV